jgi:hypothetical protein
MSGILELLFKDDLAKTVHKFVHASKLSPYHQHQEAPISLPILLLLSILMTLSKTLYGKAGYSLTQHFGTTLIINFILLGVAVLIVSLISKRYGFLNNWAVAIVTCLMATSLICAAWLLVTGGPSATVINHINDALGIDLDTTPSWIIALISISEDVGPALIYSFFGCLSVFLANWEWQTNRSRVRWRKETLYAAKAFCICWFLTTVITYFFIMDRTGFFDAVTSATAHISIF